MTKRNSVTFYLVFQLMTESAIWNVDCVRNVLTKLNQESLEKPPREIPVFSFLDPFLLVHFLQLTQSL